MSEAPVSLGDFRLRISYDQQRNPAAKVVVLGVSLNADSSYSQVKYLITCLSSASDHGNDEGGPVYSVFRIDLCTPCIALSDLTYYIRSGYRSGSQLSKYAYIVC